MITTISIELIDDIRKVFYRVGNKNKQVMENSSNKKIWTINVQVHTEYMETELKKHPGTTWDKPYGGGGYFHKQVLMTATNNKDDIVSTGIGDDFTLENVGEGDEIRWIVTEMNPLEEKKVSVVMYGFWEDSNWDKFLLPPSNVIKEMPSVYLSGAFNDTKVPILKRGEYAHVVSMTKADVKSNIPAQGTVKYLMKIVLVDTRTVKPIGYIMVDPYIQIHKRT